MDKFILIGLNNLGVGIAKVLTEAGAEVTAIERKRELLLKVVSVVKHNVLITDNEFTEFDHLDLASYSAAIVVITSDLPFSLASIAFLEKNGMKNLYVCAENEDQEKIAVQIGVTSVVRMDIEIGRLLAATLIKTNPSAQ